MTNTIKQTLENIGLSCNFEFIPFSQSRNKSEKYPSLNYKVTCLKNGREFLTTDYSMGCAHVPGYKQGDKSIDHDAMIRRACETGHTSKYFSNIEYHAKGKAILPDVEDVFYSLVMDSDVLNYSNFEDWADSLGYDTDSRSAEKIYRACLEIALATRNAIGDAGMAQLAEIFQDY